MKKYVIIAVILIFAVVVFPLGYKLVADKHIILNKLFVSDTDVIGADLSMFQGDTDMAKLKEQVQSLTHRNRDRKKERSLDR